MVRSAAMPGPSTRQLSWAALVVAVAALGVALSGAAIGLPGKKVVDRNDLKRNVVKSKHVVDGRIGLADLSQEVRDALAAEPAGPPSQPRAFALVLGPGQVDENYSRGIEDGDISVNNGAFCIRDVGFDPKHVQVTAQTSSATVPDYPSAFLDETVACQGGTAVVFASDLTYPEDFFVALYD